MCARRVLVQTEQAISLNGQRVNYQLKRSNQRRSIGFKVDGNGLSVSAPIFSRLEEIERALIEHRHWVLKKIEAWHVLEADIPSFEPGSLVWCLGRQIPIVSVPPKDAIPYILDKQTLLELPALPLAEGCSNGKAAVVAWYKVQALPWFQRHLLPFYDRLSTRPFRVELSNAKTRWGSCSPNQIIRLNWRLMQASPSEIDYVLAHECAHLRHMHHGPAFWETLEWLYPDWKAASTLLSERDRLYRLV